MSDKNVVTSTDQRGHEVVLSKPTNESTMSQAQKDEWYHRRSEHLQEKSKAKK
jgi:hypothetical protein